MQVKENKLNYAQEIFVKQIPGEILKVKLKNGSLGTVTCSLMDLQGKAISTRIDTKVARLWEVLFSIQGLAEGRYWIVAQQGEHVAWKKLII